MKNQSKIQVLPWNDWSVTPKHISPLWWGNYNDVKHSRTSLDKNTGQENYKKANLENTINALAGLLILEMYFYKDLVVAEDVSEVTIPSRASNLFIMDNWEKHISNWGNGVMDIQFGDNEYPDIKCPTGTDL